MGQAAAPDASAHIRVSPSVEQLVDGNHVLLLEAGGRRALEELSRSLGQGEAHARLARGCRDQLQVLRREPDRGASLVVAVEDQPPLRGVERRAYSGASGEDVDEQRGVYAECACERERFGEVP